MRKPRTRKWPLLAAAAATVAGLTAITAARSQLPTDPAGFACDRSPLLVTNVMLWNGSRLDRGRDVLVVDGRIRSIGRRGRVEASKTVRRIDGGGAIMLPGFIDAHTHYVLPAPAPKLDGDQDEQELAVTGKAALSSGVTTGRIHLMPLEQVRKLAAHADDPCFPAPRFELGGRALFGASPGRENMIGWGLSDRASAFRKLAEQRNAGARWIAVHDADKLPPEELDAIAAEARRLGLRIMAAGQNRAEILASLGAGARSLEYVIATETEDYDQALLRRITGATPPVYVSIPVGYYRRLAAYRADPRLLDEPEHYLFVPAGVVAEVRDRQKAQLNATSTPRRDAELVSQRFGQLLKAGAKAVIATDSGSPAQMHRTAYWNELAEWHRLKVPVPLILDAATRRPAELLDRDDLGALKIGARADFLLYSGDLFGGEFDVKKVSAVAKGGVLFVENGAWVGP